MNEKWGGKRNGAGRKEGALTSKSREIAEAALKGGISPLEYMLSIVQDEAAEAGARLDAAKAAAPYIHPRLSNIEANIAVSGHEAALDELK